MTARSPRYAGGSRSAGSPMRRTAEFRQAASRAPAQQSSREAAIARVAALIERRTSTLLVGPHGYGKTFTADTIGGRMQRAGRAVVRLSGTAADASHLLSDWRTAPSGSVFIIDDGAGLQAGGLSDLVDLTRSREHVALVTLEQERAGLPSASDDSAQRLLSVWRGGSLTRIDLPALDGFEASALADAAADDAVLDDMAKAVIVRLSNGSPRLVHELTKDALETGGEFYLPRSILSLGVAGVSPRIHDLTDPQLSRLDDEGRYALVMLAKLGPVPYSRAARLIGEHELHTLLRLGLARNDGSGQDRIVADELHAWSALAEWRHGGRLRPHDRVQRTLIADLRAGSRLTPNESFILGRYWLSADDDRFDHGFEAVTMARVYLDAAHVANVAGLAADGQLLAARAFTWRPSVSAALQQSRSLAMLGDVDGAQRVLDVGPDADSDEDIRAEVLSWRATLDRWGDRTCAQVLTERAEYSRALTRRIEMVELWRQQTDPGPTESDGLYEGVLQDDTAPQSSRLYAGAALLSRRGLHATPTELREFLHAGDAVYRRVPYNAARPLSHAMRDASAMYVLSAGTIRLLTGLSWAGFARYIDEFAERAERGTGRLATTDQCIVGLLGAQLAFFDGRPERALADLRVVERMLDSTVPPDVHAHASLILIGALAQTGQLDEAMERRTGEDRRLIASSSVLSYLADIADFSLLLADGNLTAAKLQLHHMAESGSNPLTERLYSACLASVVGTDAAEAFSWVADARDSEKTPLQGALFLLCDAGAAGDASRVEEAACSLEAVGARHRAIGAHQLAARLHTEQGRPHHARRCAERVAGLSEQPTGPLVDLAPEHAVPVSTAESFGSPRGSAASAPPTPDDALEVDRPTAHAPLAYIPFDQTMHRDGPPADVSSLTRRELEVAHLIAQGLSNQEIATRLFLSVRTVESHVLQARTKLGAGRRRDLGRIVMQSGQREA
ncbi:helix-turn-helix transcriptional regulator [Plantibacter sp. lyk4-40-MEA-4]|uniref:helix-turn-helix transcriptional regulator n=1 Tax=Plantibacter sp. lyk4-40-MEA-4 TaxID=3040298 RepID=UPI00254F20E5|nr:helix-turn-helix transcriptional regulator [Plantibacter sp. lyk4-40-MEA-4]